jgi:membrane protein DedA with SNARE-associated domain
MSEAPDAPEEPGAGEESAGSGGTRPRPPLAWVVTPIIVLVAAAYLGDALTTTWADKHPLLLLMLNARNRILVLVTNQLDPVTFYVVAGLRLLAADPLFFILGRWYGDAMVVWVEKRSSTFGEQIRLYERAFAKAAYPLVFIAPNTYICLFAGASGMPVGGFFAANIAGTILRLYLIRRVGEAFDEPIQAVLRFFGEYRLPLFIFSVALVAFIIWSDRRKGGDEISTMLDLAEHPPDEPDPEPGTGPGPTAGPRPDGDSGP